MISFSCPPVVGTIQICGVFVFAARSTSTTLKITHLPSGETCGSPTRFSFIMSSNVKGCLDWAAIDDANAMSARLTMRRRRIKFLLRQTDEFSTCHPEPRVWRRRIYVTCRRHRRYQLVHGSFAAKNAAQDDKGLR